MNEKKEKPEYFDDVNIEQQQYIEEQIALMNKQRKKKKKNKNKNEKNEEPEYIDDVENPQISNDARIIRKKQDLEYTQALYEDKVNQQNQAMFDEWKKTTINSFYGDSISIKIYGIPNVNIVRIGENKTLEDLFDFAIAHLYNDVKLAENQNLSIKSCNKMYTIEYSEHIKLCNKTCYHVIN